MAVVGFITTSFPRHDSDAAGRFVWEMARAFARRGHRVEVVVPQAAESKSRPAGSTGCAGIHVLEAPYVRPRQWQRLFFDAGVPDNLERRPWLLGLVPAALTALWVRAVLAARRWDAVISHWALPCAFIAAACGLPRRRHLTIAHSGEIHLLGQLPGRRALCRAMVQLVGTVGFVSQRGKREFCRHLSGETIARCGSKLVVTPMGIDFRTIASSGSSRSVREAFGADGLLVLVIGRLVRIKGIDVLLEALAGRSDVQLIVAGEGPLRSTLERRAAENRVRTTFVGQVDQDRRNELLAACDVVVVPSRPLVSGRQEGIPLVALEAFAAGKPVVATETGAIAELVEHGVNGLLVPSENPSALGAALGRLQEQPELAQHLAEKGRERAGGLDWDRLVPRYESLVGLT